MAPGAGGMAPPVMPASSARGNSRHAEAGHVPQLSNAVKMKRPSRPTPASKGRFVATSLDS